MFTQLKDICLELEILEEMLTMGNNCCTRTDCGTICLENKLVNRLKIDRD